MTARSTPDQVELRWLGHATVLVERPGLRLLTDPFLRGGLGPLRRHGPVPDPADLGPIDVVLISHSHPDHLDPRSLATLEGDPLVVVPVGLGRMIERLGRRVREVRVGEEVAIAPGWTIAAVPARHWRWPRTPRAQPVGYLIEGPGCDGIYFAGDTAPYRAMTAFADRVDIALLPVGTWGPHLGPGHLSPRTAAVVARDLGVRVAVPIHWGTFFPPGLDRLLGDRLREPANQFARWSADVAPDLDIRILAPGDATRVERPAQAGGIGGGVGVGKADGGTVGDAVVEGADDGPDRKAAQARTAPIR